MDELEEIKQRSKAIDERVAKMQLFHEDIIIVERIDVQASKTFLAVDPRASMQRVRTSWYARVVAISERASGDSIKEEKKKSLKIGSIVSYNPEAAYSLNIDEFPEIWCMSIECVLMVDYGFDPVSAKKIALERQKEFEQEHEVRMQVGAKIMMDQLKKAQASGAVSVSIPGEMPVPTGGIIV